MSMNQITHMNIDHRMEQIALKVITTAIYKSFRKEIRRKRSDEWSIYACRNYFNYDNFGSHNFFKSDLFQELRMKEIRLKISMAAKIANKFSREFPYTSNTFSRESPKFQTGFHVSKRSPRHSKECPIPPDNLEIQNSEVLSSPWAVTNMEMTYDTHMSVNCITHGNTNHFTYMWIWFVYFLWVWIMTHTWGWIISRIVIWIISHSWIISQTWIILCI